MGKLIEGFVLIFTKSRKKGGKTFEEWDRTIRNSTNQNSTSRNSTSRNSTNGNSTNGNSTYGNNTNRSGTNRSGTNQNRTNRNRGCAGSIKVNKKIEIAFLGLEILKPGK